MMLESAYDWIDLFCRKIFRHGLTENIREFIGHLSWSFFGGVFASGVLLMTNILAGRWLGVAEYGKYNAVFSLAQILLVFFLVGMDLSVVRNLVQIKREGKDHAISASLGTVVGWIIICGLIFFFIGPSISRFFQVDPVLLSSAFLLGCILAVRQLTDSIIRGLHWFKKQAFLRILEAIFILLSFLILAFTLGKTTFISYTSSLEIGGLFLISFYLFFIQRYLRPFLIKDITLLFEYGKIVFLAGLFGIIFSSLDKLAIAKYLDFNQLGIYGAYYTASFILVSQVGALFDNVFFPTVTRLKDNLAPLISKIDRLTLLLFVPFLIGMSVIITFLLLLFGPQYPLQWGYVFGFSLLAALKMILIINTSIITAYSSVSLKLGVVYGNLINLLFIALFLAYISYFQLSITVMLIFLVIYTAIFIMLNKWILYRVGFYRTAL